MNIEIKSLLLALCSLVYLVHAQGEFDDILSSPDGRRHDESAVLVNSLGELSRTQLQKDPSLLEVGNVQSFFHEDEHENSEIEIVEEDFDIPIEKENEGDTALSDQHRPNFASKGAGAFVMAHNPEMTGVDSLLTSDGDKYCLSRCDVKKWIVISLSEDVLMDSFVISNEEKYSSSVENFRVLGSQKYPTNEWLVLGNFTAENRLGEQMFLLTSRSWVRFLKFQWQSHYGNEYYCTWSSIKVHGSTMLEDLQQHMLTSEAQVQVAKAQLERQGTVSTNPGGTFHVIPSSPSDLVSTIHPDDSNPGKVEGMGSVVTIDGVGESLSPSFVDSSGENNDVPLSVEAEKVSGGCVDGICSGSLAEVENSSNSPPPLMESTDEVIDADQSHLSPDTDTLSAGLGADISGNDPSHFKGELDAKDNQPDRFSLLGESQESGKDSASESQPDVPEGGRQPINTSIDVLNKDISLGNVEISESLSIAGESASEVLSSSRGDPSTCSSHEFVGTGFSDGISRENSKESSSDSLDRVDSTPAINLAQDSSSVSTPVPSSTSAQVSSSPSQSFEVENVISQAKSKTEIPTSGMTSDDSFITTPVLEDTSVTADAGDKAVDLVEDVLNSPKDTNHSLISEVLPSNTLQTEDGLTHHVSSSSPAKEPVSMRNVESMKALQCMLRQYYSETSQNPFSSQISQGTDDCVVDEVAFRESLESPDLETSELELLSSPHPIPSTSASSQSFSINSNITNTTTSNSTLSNGVSGGNGSPNPSNASAGLNMKSNPSGVLSNSTSTVPPTNFSSTGNSTNAAYVGLPKDLIAPLSHVQALGYLAKRDQKDSHSKPPTQSQNVFKALSSRLKDTEIDQSVLHTYVAELHLRHSQALHALARSQGVIAEVQERMRNGEYGMRHSGTFDSVVDKIMEIQRAVASLDDRLLRTYALSADEFAKFAEFVNNFDERVSESDFFKSSDFEAILQEHIEEILNKERVESESSQNGNDQLTKVTASIMEHLAASHVAAIPRLFWDDLNDFFPENNHFCSDDSGSDASSDDRDGNGDLRTRCSSIERELQLDAVAIELALQALPETLTSSEQLESSLRRLLFRARQMQSKSYSGVPRSGFSGKNQESTPSTDHSGKTYPGTVGNCESKHTGHSSYRDLHTGTNQSNPHIKVNLIEVTNDEVGVGMKEISKLSDDSNSETAHIRFSGDDLSKLENNLDVGKVISDLDAGDHVSSAVDSNSNDIEDRTVEDHDFNGVLVEEMGRSQFSTSSPSHSQSLSEESRVSSASDQSKFQTEPSLIPSATADEITLSSSIGEIIEHSTESSSTSHDGERPSEPDATSLPSPSFESDMVIKTSGNHELGTFDEKDEAFLNVSSDHTFLLKENECVASNLSQGCSFSPSLHSGSESSLDSLTELKNSILESDALSLVFAMKENSAPPSRSSPYQSRRSLHREDREHPISENFMTEESAEFWTVLRRQWRLEQPLHAFEGVSDAHSLGKMRELFSQPSSSIESDSVNEKDVNHPSEYFDNFGHTMVSMHSDSDRKRTPGSFLGGSDRKTQEKPSNKFSSRDRNSEKRKSFSKSGEVQAVALQGLLESLHLVEEDSAALTQVVLLMQSELRQLRLFSVVAIVVAIPSLIGVIALSIVLWARSKALNTVERVGLAKLEAAAAKSGLIGGIPLKNSNGGDSASVSVDRKRAPLTHSMSSASMRLRALSGTADPEDLFRSITGVIEVDSDGAESNHDIVTDAILHFRKDVHAEGDLSGEQTSSTTVDTILENPNIQNSP